MGGVVVKSGGVHSRQIELTGPKRVTYFEFHDRYGLQSLRVAVSIVAHHLAGVGAGCAAGVRIGAV